MDISLYGHRRGGETTTTYLVRHCFRGVALKDERIDIKTIERLPLRAIGFTIARLCGSATLPLLTKAQIQISVECLQPTIFNWCEGVVANFKGKLTRGKPKNSIILGMVPLSSRSL